jgi:N-carbamoyl-L-amino-acid hydrolase
VSRASKQDFTTLGRAVDARMRVAADMFDTLATRTADTEGVTRAAYGAGEQVAQALFAETAQSLGLAFSSDFAGNGYATLPGKQTGAPAFVTGSHLDSVPRGGNYDGAAGVVAGLAALAAIGDIGHTPDRDLTVMAVRSEECSSWFRGEHSGHLGSRAALGLMRPEELDTAIHLDTGKTLGEQMAACGLDPERLVESPPHLGKKNVAAYLELHIEQGPVLVAEDKPVGIVTGIRGNMRARDARCLGEYTHSGAVPQADRHDAVLATAEFLVALERETGQVLDSGGDIVFATGKLYTDAAMHSVSKVPGEVAFTLDIRSLNQATLDRMSETARTLASDIGRRRGVRFALDPISFSAPTVMDPDHIGTMNAGCQHLDIPAIDIASGGGHDAQEFARSGIASSMIFVRNANGSHNAGEAMDMEDFRLGTRLLTWMLAFGL